MREGAGATEESVERRGNSKDGVRVRGTRGQKGGTRRGKGKVYYMVKNNRAARDAATVLIHGNEFLVCVYLCKNN